MCAQYRSHFSFLRSRSSTLLLNFLRVVALSFSLSSARSRSSRVAPRATPRSSAFLSSSNASPLSPPLTFPTTENRIFSVSFSRPTLDQRRNPLCFASLSSFLLPRRSTLTIGSSISGKRIRQLWINIDRYRITIIASFSPRHKKIFLRYRSFNASYRSQKQKKTNFFFLFAMRQR